MKFLSFGEILWDVYPDGNALGGAPLNFAAHLAKHREKVYMLSAIGKDELGSEAVAQLKAWGVSSEYVSSLDDKSTGKCLVSLDENKVPSYNLLTDVAYDYISAENLEEGFDVLYFGTLSLRSGHNFNTLSSLLKASKFNEVFVDVNIRPPFYSAETVRFAVVNATILKISDEELATVSEQLRIEKSDYKDFAKKLADTYSNLKIIIITRGAKGSFALDCKSGEEFSCGCERVELKSTVGAGDSFSAAFLHKYLGGNSIQFCLEYASKIADFVVSNYDAVPTYNAEDFK